MDESSSAPQSTDSQQPPPSPQPPTAAALTPVATVSSPNPNSETASRPPNIPQSPQSGSSPQTRPQFNTRPWQQQQPQQQNSYTHFSLPSPPLPASAAVTPSPISAPLGGVAIGVPASHTPAAATPQSASFPSITSTAFGQQSQIRQPMLPLSNPASAPPSLRPAGVPNPQLRPSQPSLRPQASTSGQSPSSQPQNQPWLSSGPSGKPPLPSTSLRPTTQLMQQRSNIPQQQQHNISSSTPQQHTNSNQQPGQSPVATTGGAGFAMQRPSLSASHSVGIQPNRTTTSSDYADEFSNRIINKRSIQNIASQIDPSERLDSELESILVDIGEEYLESILTSGCSLAKHRKSSSLEVKDILLHVERNWNMTLPGFGGDEIKSYKKPLTSEIHKERVAAIKKSILAVDKTGISPSVATNKTHTGKGSSAVIGSPPNSRLRDNLLHHY